MSVTLTNRTRRMMVLNLPHESYCEALGRCACTPHPLKEDATVATSLTIPAGQAVADQPEAVLSAPDVEQAVQAGELAVEQSKSPASEPAPAAPGKKPRTDKKNGGTP